MSPNSTTTLSCQLVKNVAVGDMKVKDFTLKIALGVCLCPTCFALVYVPYPVTVEGLKLSVGTSTDPLQLYDPPQNVILSGTLPTTSSVPVTFHGHLARNMEPNDKIVLLFNPIYPNTSSTNWEIPIDIMLNCLNTFH
jgi:hypothetical protein